MSRRCWRPTLPRTITVFSLLLVVSLLEACMSSAKSSGGSEQGGLVRPKLSPSLSQPPGPTPAPSLPPGQTWPPSAANPVLPSSTPLPIPALSPLPGSSSGSESCYKASAEVCAIEYHIFELTNSLRKSKGLRPFSYSAHVAFVARAWSQTQAKRSNISHQGWPSQRESLYRQEFHTSFDSNAENVAMTGGSGPNLADEFYRMWLNSPGHYRNMVGDSDVLGVGVAEGDDGWYATQLFGSE